MRKSFIFVKHAQSGDEANLHSLIVENMVILHQNVIVYIMLSYFLVSVQRTAQTSLRIFLQTSIMVDGAKFNSHDSGGHF